MPTDAVSQILLDSYANAVLKAELAPARLSVRHVAILDRRRRAKPAVGCRWLVRGASSHRPSGVRAGGGVSFGGGYHGAARPIRPSGGRALAGRSTISM